MEYDLAAGGEWGLGMNAEHDPSWKLKCECADEAPHIAVQAVVHSEQIAFARQPQEALGGCEQFIVAVIRPRVGHN